MICSRCGASIPDGINFCIKCGFDLRQQTSVPAPQPATDSNHAVPSYPQPEFRQPVQPRQPMPENRQPMPENRQPVQPRQPMPEFRQPVQPRQPMPENRQPVQPRQPLPENRQPLPENRQPVQPQQSQPEFRQTARPQQSQPEFRQTTRPQQSVPAYQEPNQVQQPASVPDAPAAQPRQNPQMPWENVQTPVMQDPGFRPLTVPSAEVARAQKEKKPAQPKPEKPPKAPTPAKEKRSGKGGLLAAFLIALALALIASAAFALLYFDVFDFWKKDSSHENTVDVTDAEGNELTAEDAVKQLQEENAVLIEKVASLEGASGDAASLKAKADRYDALIDFYSTERPNVGSNKFFADVPVVVMRVNDAPAAFHITADYGQQVSVNIVSYKNVAKASWTEGQWNKTTEVMVTPVAPGATVVTFNNDLNSDTFRVLIIVTE